MGTLTATKVEKLKPDEKDYRLHDGNGLYLVVRKTGTKTFMHRIRKPRDTFQKIGNYPAVSLAEARAFVTAKQLKKDQVESAIDRVDEKFCDVAYAWADSIKGNYSQEHNRKLRVALENDINPYIGNKHIAAVTSKDIYKILKPIEDRDAKHMAIKIKGWLHAIFKYAIRNLNCENDPTLAVDVARPKPIQHSVALSDAQLKRLFNEFENSTVQHRTKIANRLLVLTMLRTAELFKTKYSDIDFDKKILVIGRERMKRGIAHVVPLSDYAIELFNEMRQFSGDSEYVFPPPKDKNKNMSLTTVYAAVLVTRPWLRDLKFSPHGYRATSSTMLNQWGYRSDIIEKQLAHSSSDKVRGSYNHADYLDERRVMLQTWSDYIQDIVKKATPKIINSN